MSKKNANRRVDTKRTLLRDTRGLTTVEYIIILCLIAVTGFALWQNFGSSVNAKVGSSTTKIDSLPTE
jgi:Flp pilus assembly pilin Flp